MIPSDLIYALTVPSAPESLAVLDDLCEAFITETEALPSEVATILRLSVSEACRNALARVPVEGRMGVVTLRVLRTNDVPLGVGLEIEDPGPGITVGGYLPPYPESLVGTTHELARPLSQHVWAVVQSPLRAVVASQELDSAATARGLRASLQSPTPHFGLGMLALCRCWREVLFTYDPARGNCLRLTGAVV